MPKKINLKLIPLSSFDIPYSEGYQLYSALLNLIRENNKDFGDNIKKSDVDNLNIGTLRGPMGSGTISYHKSVYGEKEYDLSIGIADSNKEYLFQKFFEYLSQNKKPIALPNGEFNLNIVNDIGKSYNDIVVEAQDKNPKEVSFKFLTPTCIEYKESSITEMFPHRTAVFNSILSKWNMMSKEERKIGLDSDNIGKSLIENPKLDSLDNFSVKIGSFYNTKKGREQSILKQGFKGICSYRFSSNATQNIRNSVIALSIFAEFSGVGTAVSRGCGSVKTWMK